MSGLHIRWHSVSGHEADYPARRSAEGGTRVPTVGTSLAHITERGHDGRMTITFVTGANEGPGREAARRHFEQDQSVLLGVPYLGRRAPPPDRRTTR